MPRLSRQRRSCVKCGHLRYHAGRGLCNACYKHHLNANTHAQFPIVRENVSPRARYEGWVASGLTVNEYARQLGIWNTSLARALRVERERLDRLGLPWLTGWRKVINGPTESEDVDGGEAEGNLAEADRG
jgi:hypothetical protein